MQTDISAQKKQLRAHALALRAFENAQEKQSADLALCHHIAAQQAFSQADLLLAFSPVRGEPDLTPLFELALQRGIVLAFPRCEGKQMHFHAVNALCALEAGRFGIPAPTQTAPRVQPTARTLCLLPGLGATKDGHRLGYGGGFYDRFLADFPGVTLFPIYEKLLFPSLPREPFDLAAQIVISEKGVVFTHV